VPEISKISETAPPNPTAGTPFRFSLLTLLSVTTLAGFTSAVVFSPGWDPLERLLMAFWCAGLLLGVSIGRARGKPGMFSAGLGASLGCMLATLMLHPVDSLVLTFAIVTGWFLAVGMTAIYHALLTGIVESWWQLCFFRLAIYSFAASSVVSLVVWQALSDRPWRPTWELKVAFDPRDSLDFALSPQGDRLLTTVDSRYGYVNPDLAGQMHELAPRVVVSQPLSLGWGFEALTFSPDGLQVAATHGTQFRVFAASSGHITYTQLLDTRHIEQQPLLPARFGPNSKQLLVTTHTPRIQRLHTYDLTNTDSPHIELFPFAGQLLLSADGSRLVKFFDAEDENGERRVEIMDLNSWQTSARIDDVPRVVPPVFSRDGKRFALGDRIWTLPAGPPRNAGGEVIGLLSGGRVLIKEQARDHWPGWLPDWLHEMPFLRHLHSRETNCRLCLRDETTGRLIRATPWLENIDRVQLSANERVAAATSSTGQFRIWKVPKSMTT
jgi:hypothetical protein